MTQTASRTTVYIGLEATQGTRAATLIPIEVDTFNENDQVQEAVRSGARGNINAEHGSEIVQESSEVQLSGDLSDQIIGIILACVYGVVTTTADDPETDVHTHDYSVANNNEHPTFTVVFADPGVGTSGEYRECLGCQIGTYETPLDPGANAKFDVKFVGRSSQAGADPATSYLDENFFVTPNVEFLIADTQADLDSAEPLCVQTGKLMIDKGAQKQFTIGSGKNPKKCYNGRITGKLEATIEYENDEYINLERDNGAKWARLKFTSPVTIGAASNPSIVHDFPNCKVRELTRDRNLENELRQSFAIKCENMAGATAKIVNEKATYVAD